MTERVKSIARAQFLGTQRIEIGGEVITPEAERLFGMIVRLSVPLGRMTARQTMMETLWPGIDEANARHNLRQTVYKARELGLVVESGEDGLRLDPRHWSCDWEDATGDVPGEWLPDYNPEFSDELRSWVGSQRIGVHAMVRPRLIRSLQSARASGDLIIADRHARQLLQIDELNEEATLTRAELMAMQGAKVDALRLLDAYLHEIGRVGSGKDAALPAQLLRRRIAEKLPSVSYSNGSTHHGPLVARAAECKRLLASLFDARAGRGTATVLCGNEGIGKSRLLFEVRKAAVLQGMLIVALACESGPAAVPFSTLRTLTSRLLALPGALGISPEALCALREWTGGTTAAPDDCPVAEIEDLLASIAEETPLLLLLEHAERMDAESLGRLDRVYRRGAGRHHTLMLTSCTTGVPTDSPVELRGIERLVLRPLTLVDVRSIVTAYAAAELPRATEDQIACAAVFAEGNPMYGIEMLGLILDPGSPDVIPWRVKVAVERIVGEMSELERRLLIALQLFNACASPERLALALGCTCEQIIVSLGRLEATGHASFKNGAVVPSKLATEDAHRQSNQASIRHDCRRGALALEAEAKSAPATTNEFLCRLRLWVTAGEDDCAVNTIRTGIKDTLRRTSAGELVFELERIKQLTQSPNLCDSIDRVVDEIRGASHSSKPKTCEDSRGGQHEPFTERSLISRDTEHQISSTSIVTSSLEEATNVRNTPTKRLTDASTALFFAFNRNDTEALAAAYRAVSAVRHSKEVNPFDVHRADLIYHAYHGNRSQTIESAEALATEARKASNVEVMCKGLRNSAEAVLVYGMTGRAQELLLESRSIAAALGYPAQVVWADLNLAALFIETMDTSTASQHLKAASDTCRANELRVPLIHADLNLYGCWLAVVNGDMPAAQRFSRNLNKAFAGKVEGTALWAKTGARLASQCSRIASQEVDLLSQSIGSRGHYTIEHFSLAALVLHARVHGDYREASRFAAKHASRMNQNGRQPWPFLEGILA